MRCDSGRPHPAFHLTGRQENIMGHGAHPSWCGQGHYCSSGSYRGDPVGQHRSQPVTFHAGPGSVVATRVRTHSGADQVEVRLVLHLPDADETTQAWAGKVLLERVQAALTQPLPQLAGVR